MEAEKAIEMATGACQQRDRFQNKDHAGIRRSKAYQRVQENIYHGDDQGKWKKCLLQNAHMDQTR